MGLKPYEPDQFAPPPRHTNVAAEQTLKTTFVFGNGVLTKTMGRSTSGARNSQGNFSLSLPRTYRHMTEVRFAWSLYPAGAVLFPVVSSDDSGTDAGDGGGSVTFETRTEAGVATDPPDGAELVVTFCASLDGLNDDQYGTP